MRNILINKPQLVAILLLLCPHLSLFAKNVIVSGEKPLNQQLILPNCTYIIESECKLIKDCKVPSNCELLFKGGYIEGTYTLIGDNTYINASPSHIFSENITLAGTWSNNRCYAEWFGAKGNLKIDDREAIQKALDVQIPVLELLPKSYLIASYYDAKEYIGLNIPAKKNIVGHAVDGWSKEYSLVAKGGMPFNVLLQLAGIHITLKNISVFGARDRDYELYKVKDIIATKQDKYYTGLHLEYVFASGCKENGINLYTYNSRLENCYVTNCDVAYYIHGGNGRGTSTHLLMCTAEYARKNAYKICKMGYCLLELCAADHCALGTITGKHEKGDIYGYNYYYEDCRGISEISCAHEAGGYSHFIYDCRGVSVHTGRYTCEGINMNSDWSEELSSNIWYLKASHDIEIAQTTLATALVTNSRLVTIGSNVSNCHFNSCFYVTDKSKFVSATKKNIVQKEDIVTFD